MKNTKFTLSHSSFSVLFTTILYGVYSTLNFDKIVKWFVLGDTIDYLGLIAFLLFGLCFFMAFFTLFAHRFIIKPIAIIFIVLSAPAAYFISKYNVAVDHSMVVNAVNTDFTEVMGLLSLQMIPYLLFLITIPIFFITKITISFQKPIKYLQKSLLLFFVSLSISIGLIYLQFNSIHRAVNQSQGYVVYSLVPINLIHSIGGIVQEYIGEHYQKPEKSIKISGEITAKTDLTVVLVIGETARQKNFNLYGYQRANTNPILTKKSELHSLNGIARIGSTLYALREILEKDGIKLPTITSQLGVKTNCYVNYTFYDNCAAVGEITVNNCGHNGKCYDEDVVPLLKKALQSDISGQQLIVLHLGGGSHGPIYKYRHPPEFQKLKPQCLSADVVNQCTLTQLYNSYDNTILYLDFVLGQIIDTMDNSNKDYVFIYLSDHGESLLEDGRVFHGMPPGIDLPPEQAQIPLLVKSSIPISIVKRSEYLQPDVFDTVLDLLNIRADVLDKSRVFIKKM